LGNGRRLKPLFLGIDSRANAPNAMSRLEVFPSLGVDASMGLGWLDAVHPDERASS
jgi:hypothetical protein